MTIFLGVMRKGFETVVAIGANGSEARRGIALSCDGRNVGFSMERLNQGEEMSEEDIGGREGI